jgi:hypothetical protein
VPQVESVSIPNTDPPQNSYFCCALAPASWHPEQNALLLYLVVFGEFGKNFIEIGNRPKVREAMLRLRSRHADTKFDSTDFRNTVPRFSAENRKANQALVDLLSRFAEQEKATPAQVALAWLLAKKPGIVPIPGTTKLHRLEENLGAADVELTPEDLRALESASSKIKVVGAARYPEFHEQLTGR